MLELVLVIIGLLIISFVCSILESVILSLSRPYIQGLLDRKKKSGTMLVKMKNRIEEPISAILTLNTISHTAGAAVSGAIALNLFGSEWMALFSGILTLLILIFSEIIPKTIGAGYWRQLGPLAAYVLRFLIILLAPLIIPMNFLSRLFTKGESNAVSDKKEIINFIRLGHAQGLIDEHEHELMQNVFKLKVLQTKDIMTPRTVVTWLPCHAKIDDVTGPFDIDFSRIPLYDSVKNAVTGIVLRRDIIKGFNSKKNKTLKSLAEEPVYVIETHPVFKLLDIFIKNKMHMAVVLNEYGDYVGIVTLEDVLETVIGREILDENDRVADMQELARKQIKKRKPGP